MPSDDDCCTNLPAWSAACHLACPDPKKELANLVDANVPVPAGIERILVPSDNIISIPNGDATLLKVWINWGLLYVGCAFMRLGSPFCEVTVLNRLKVV